MIAAWFRAFGEGFANGLGHVGAIALIAMAAYVLYRRLVR